ncbi:ANK1 [Symbiodinium sp. CCMP2456]|nr:ANK1 [Symbiodinium sp. CCMP2456]
MWRVYLASGESLVVHIEDLPHAVWPPSVLVLKQHLGALCGQPRFKQRLLRDGVLLEDSELLETSLDLQLVVLPFSETTQAQCRGLMQAIVNNYAQEVESILQRPQDPDLISKPGSSPEPSALHLALQLRRVQIVELLLEAWADVDKPDLRGSSPLFKAVDIHHLEVIRALLAARADADKANLRGETPLFNAATNGLAEAARLLVDAGADKNKVSCCGKSPLHMAILRGHSAVARVLLETRADLNCTSRHGSTPLGMAAELGELETARLLLENHADTATADKDGWTPLLLACRKGYLEVADLLLQAGANVDQANKDGETPLAAVLPLKGQADAGVRLLTQASAEVDKADVEGRTPLLVACLHGHLEIAELLIGAGATLQKAIERSSGNVVAGNAHPEIVHMLSQAAADGCVETVRLLLKAGADKEELNTFGATPLYMAALCGHASVAQLLLEQRASPDTSTEDGSTPLRMAAAGNSEHGDLLTTQLLLQAGADKDRADDAGCTPLLMACIRGKLEVVRALVDAGADVNQANRNGETPLVATEGSLEGAEPLEEADSRRHAYLEIAKLLVEAGAARTKAGRCGLSAPVDSMPQLEDERREEQPAAPTVPAVPAEVDWLASLKGKRVPHEAPSKAAKRPKRKDDGRALDIPPFWRTASIEELSESLQSLRERMLPRIRKMAKDARREDQKRGGHLKPRTAALGRV